MIDALIKRVETQWCDQLAEDAGGQLVAAWDSRAVRWNFLGACGSMWNKKVGQIMAMIKLQQKTVTLTQDQALEALCALKKSGRV